MIIKNRVWEDRGLAANGEIIRRKGIVRLPTPPPSLCQQKNPPGRSWRSPLPPSLHAGKGIIALAGDDVGLLPPFEPLSLGALDDA